MDSLRDRLLQHEGIDPSGASPQEVIKFRTLLAEEQRRSERLGWMAQIPLWGVFLILLGLCVSESFLEHLNIPFITAFGAVVIGIWLVGVPMAHRIATQLQQSRRRMSEIQRALPECKDIRPGGIPVVARIPVVRMTPKIWKTCMTGLLVFVGMVSVFCFFQGNDVYARAMDALKQAQTIHAIGYGFKDGQRVKTSEIWHQQGRGTHVQGMHGDRVIDVYDDGRYTYRYAQGLDYVIKSQTQQPSLPRELTEPVRYLKWSRRDASRDRQDQGRLYQCYRREDPNTLSLMWIEWKDETPRFRHYEEYLRIKDQWEQQESVEIEYDLPMDLVMPPAVFEQQGVRIVEPQQVLQAQYSLDRSLARTEALGLTFAVHDLQRWGDYLFITCSARPTEESLRELKAKGHGETLPKSVTYGGLNLMNWWQRKADGEIEEHPYAILELGQLRQDGVETHWYALLPKGLWSGQGERFEVCAHVRTHGALSELRKEKGLPWHEQFRPLLTLAIPKEETPIEQLASQFHDLAPMVVETMHSSQALFASEVSNMGEDRFQAHFKGLLTGMRPMQELWDQAGSDLNIECVDEGGRPVPGVLVGSGMCRTDRGAYSWYDRKGHRLDALVSDDEGHIQLEGQRIFSPTDSRNALACLYAFHEQKDLAAVVRASEQAFGSPVRVTLQPASHVMARFKDPQSGMTGPKVQARLSTTLPVTPSSGLIVDVLSYTLTSGRFEALLPSGDYELSVYDAAAPSEIKAHRRFVVPKGTRDLDLGEIELAAR